MRRWGLPTANFDDDFLEAAFDAYRKKDQRAGILAGLNGKYAIAAAEIEMVGVWETVGALGIPSLLGGVAPLLYGFLDTSLNAKVVHAYHAVAIDERRVSFPPTLWTSAPAAGQTLEQVWFTGVHCDVGGGYPECDLSNITLGWMMGKAAALGVQFDPAVAAQYAALEEQWALGAKA